MNPSEIRKLDETVINRIAAGEIIQRPANALKELMENSLDAKSTNIQIVVKSGGLKYLQIQDNGTGIRKDDMEIVCERFTTSKLQTFDDLKTIGTYGFRGEALASISHIAHLTIQTKTAQEKCAYKASYTDGKLNGPIKACASNQGTQITIEDLFYNSQQRRQALKNPNDEFHKISDVVSKYAVHNSNVGFTLKKYGEQNFLKTQSKSTPIDNIRNIFGHEIAKQLIEVQDSDDVYQFKLRAFITNVNYSSKKGIFMLFINHRLVESTALKNVIDQIYSTYMAKGMHPFMYMSLELNPNNVDVNIHPTKHEVHFLHEDEILQKIRDIIESKLLGSNETRQLYTQKLLPGASEPILSQDDTNKDSQSESTERMYAKDFVRTDYKEQKLEKFFGQATLVPNSAYLKSLLSQPIAEDESSGPSMNSQSLITISQMTNNKSNTKMKVIRRDVKLTSVLTLRKQIEDNCHANLRQLFNEFVFVGVIDTTYALIQHETKLFLCNTELICKELFYQLILYNLKNFGTIILENPLSVKELALFALKTNTCNWTPEDGPIIELAEEVETLLIKHSALLRKYFNLTVTDNGMLTSLPLLLENHLPSMAYLPMYLLRLATDVEWENEKKCFKTFSHETATFYAKCTQQNTVQKTGNWQWTIEYVIYPAIKQYFLPSKKFLWNKSLLQIANLQNLYKVFERC